MANRPKGFGMTAELQNRKDAKYDEDLAQEVITWMDAVVGEPSGASADADSLHAALKDGVFLCKLITAIKPSNIKINESKMAFKMMENIGNFLTACENIGCNKVDLFQTVDLYEAQNMPQVVNGIVALGRKAQTIGYDGPRLGPAEATENKRTFTEEQLRAGEGVIGLQMGSNQGASQAGQNFGKTRAIID